MKCLTPAAIAASMSGFWLETATPATVETTASIPFNVAWRDD
jgi:hypothetical protein